MGNHTPRKPATPEVFDPTPHKAPLFRSTAPSRQQLPPLFRHQMQDLSPAGSIRHLAANRVEGHLGSITLCLNTKSQQLSLWGGFLTRQNLRHLSALLGGSLVLPRHSDAFFCLKLRSYRRNCFSNSCFMAPRPVKASFLLVLPKRPSERQSGGSFAIFQLESKVTK